uniref:Uncharacterized protein n=1 Tax=Anguilla anguilla TaxID=7936 RepID=A0A0E9R3S9_ANGAN
MELQFESNTFQTLHSMNCKTAGSICCSWAQY